MRQDKCILNMEKAVQGYKWIDTSGYGNDGDMTGARFKESSVFFDGTDDYVSLYNKDKLKNMINGLTWEVLIKPADVSLNPHGASSYGATMGKWNISGDNRSWSLGIGYHYAGGFMSAISSNGANYDVRSWDLGLQVGVWYHILVSQLGTARSLYLDGVDQGSADSSVGGTLGGCYVSTTGAYVGRTWNWSGDGCHFKGHIARAVIYDCPQRADQVAAIYERSYRKI